MWYNRATSAGGWGVDETAIIHRPGIRKPEAHDKARGISESDGRDDSVVLLGRGDSSLLSNRKKRNKSRDPEMHQTKKGNQWYFGMKIHAGVDSGSGYVHTITGTAANVHDTAEVSKLIREDDEVVYGDSGYLGVEKQEDVLQDEHLSQVEFRINKRPSSLKMKVDSGINWDKAIEHGKSAVRCKVEHPFLIVKRQFGYAKTVYRGIAKNLNRFHILFASANILMCFRAGRKKHFTACMG